MDNIESLISWIGSFLILIVVFSVLNKRTKKAAPLSRVLKVITVGVCFHINVICSLLLYEPILVIFDISTDGFMNLNGLFTLAIIWLLITVIVFAIAKAVKEKLGLYYAIIRITQRFFFVLPFLIVFLFLLGVSLK